MTEASKYYTNALALIAIVNAIVRNSWQSVAVAVAAIALHGFIAFLIPRRLDVVTEEFEKMRSMVRALSLKAGLLR